MAKTFRPWDVEQRWLLPPSVDELVPEGHLAHFVRDTMRDELDLSEVMTAYDEERGYPPFHPVMMTALLLYSYCQGLCSSRRIAKACVERVDFMAVIGRSHPDFRTVAKFRKRHLPALARLFEQVLRLCERASMVQLGHVALDGTKIKANASQRKAMSYGRMKEIEPKLAAEVQSWFDKAEADDAADDDKHGVELSGDELPTWVVNKEQRRQRIQAAMAQLEAEARAEPDDDPPPTDGGALLLRSESNADKAPADKKQLNFTDPQSKIMKTADGFIQGYNCQAAVDSAAQIIVAHEVVAAQNDNNRLVPMLDKIAATRGATPSSSPPTAVTFPRRILRRFVAGRSAATSPRARSSICAHRRRSAQQFEVHSRRRCAGASSEADSAHAIGCASKSSSPCLVR